MSITIKSKRSNAVKLKDDFEVIIDVTSKSDTYWVKFSPFYPHRNIPIPFSDGYFSETVEGIWQGLKVFKNYDIDVSKFEISSMKGIKRTCRKYGTVIGHQKGIKGAELLDYLNARYQIYLPSYQWVLDNKLYDEIKELKNITQVKNVVLLDYETNCDLNNLNRPLSHAFLIKKYIENDYPVPLKGEKLNL